jgi:uncharacterized protein
MMTRLLINIDQIKPGGLNIECRERTQDFPVLAELSASGEVEFIGPVEIHLQVNRTAELISVAGGFEVPVRLACSRCLTPFDTDLAHRFDITYVRELAGDDHRAVETEIELNREDLRAVFFQGEEIDMRPAVEEQVVLALPMRSLCRKSCRGICPQCGSNLNQGSCDCRPETVDNRFAVLKDFNVKK